MIEPKRQEVLNALAELSTEFPDWRLGQMVANLAVVARGASLEAIWDVEDEELLDAIRQQIKKRRGRASVPA